MLDERIDRLTQEVRQAKAALINGGGRYSNAAILAGADYENPGPTSFLKYVADARRGDSEAGSYVKSVLGTSLATGTAIVPNNFVADLVQQIAATNVWRGIMGSTPGVIGAGVDIPYEVTGLTAALLQGAYGSNKDVRDFSFNRATATLYTIAQIADVGNQLLRQSNGAAEKSARHRLAISFGIAESQFITNGSGSGQPLGIFPAFLAYGDPAGFKTALSSESRASAIGRGISALEVRGVPADGLTIVMHPTDYWELATETLGTSGSGGWVLDPAGGAAGSPPITTLWGVPIKRDPWWPAAQIGTVLVGSFSDIDIYTGQEYRIDVSSEAGNRFDQNVTGFRAEEEFAFNAEPLVRTGRVQKVTGI
jgi:HK97 family phage major capsid protein